MQRTNKYKPAIGLTVTALLTALYYRIGENNAHDQISAGIIALSFGMAALVVLIFTEMWSWRAVGVMIAMAGTSIVYALIWGRANDLFNANPLLTRSILRASLDLGGLLLLMGLVIWAIERHRGNRPAIFEWIDGDSEA